MRTLIARSFLISIAVLLSSCGASENPAQETQIKQSQKGWQLDIKGDLNSFFECLEAEDKTLISAHRGGAYPGYPENALESAQYVSSQIPALYEIDVATSKDGILYLMHDDTLERTTTGSGKANAATWSELSQLRLEDKRGKATRFHPPKLENFLQWAKGRSLVQIDFKRSTRFEDAIDIVRSTGMENHVIYIAYSMAQARKLHRLAPKSMVSVSVDSLSELNSAIASGIDPSKLLAFTGTSNPRPRVFNMLNSRDVEVIFGTLGGRDAIDKDIAAGRSNVTYTELSKAGVDIIATDRPLEAYKALQKTGRAVDSPICGISRS